MPYFVARTVRNLGLKTNIASTFSEQSSTAAPAVLPTTSTHLLILMLIAILIALVSVALGAYIFLHRSYDVALDDEESKIYELSAPSAVGTERYLASRPCGEPDIPRYAVKPEDPNARSVSPDSIYPPTIPSSRTSLESIYDEDPIHPFPGLYSLSNTSSLRVAPPSATVRIARQYRFCAVEPDLEDIDEYDEEEVDITDAI